jgi:hypothetical protein
MTIKTDSFNASVDFIYNFNDENTGASFNLKVKYHMTEIFGETVSIWKETSPGDFNSISIDFPVKFFTEISNLLSKGINIGSTVIKKPIEPSMKISPKNTLPVTNIIGGNVSNAPIFIETDDKAIESFSSVDKKDTSETNENIIHDNKEKEEIFAETLTKEAATILEERKQALVKAQKNTKIISRKE